MTARKLDASKDAFRLRWCAAPLHDVTPITADWLHWPAKEALHTLFGAQDGQNLALPRAPEPALSSG
ncbi:hypothetical protein DKT77_00765 [Meridianimarinicoccus roseus]|uniref:Uncharacterized protein n=1 Tax=Meridianimarinicoccus roseus TaxID=2072018 RepID=A0A2V2LK95_9RHOB|nr:hypothetical protein [Meridianimarinicoccus roseus]PWR04531.1 hypothetical protein DKT77_00765 [Meridianimarinicoccus roseus]